jgi:hypothetical protein
MQIYLTDGDQPKAGPEKRELLAVVTPWADTFSKTVAGIAIALYASGFLIISLHHSRFGFVGTNPFRPRVLAAGAWFVFFTGIPVSIAARYRNYSWRQFAKESSGVWLLCYGLSVPLGYILFDFSTLTTFSSPRLWVLIGLFGIVILLLVLAKYEKIPAWLATVASVLLTVFYMFDPLRRFFTNHEFELTSLALWFFWCTAATFMEFTMPGAPGSAFLPGCRPHGRGISSCLQMALTVPSLISR